MSDVALLPKLPINGKDAEEESLRLHLKHNKAIGPDLDELGLKPVPPGLPYPCALYRDWEESAKRVEMFKTANLMGLNLNDPNQAAVVEAQLPEWQTLACGVDDRNEDGWTINQRLRDKNDRDKRQFEAMGWVDSPHKIRKAVDRLNKAVALAAAERAYDDRHLGEQARAELEAIEDAADDHVVEVPEAPRRGPGRPRKGDA